MRIAWQCATCGKAKKDRTYLVDLDDAGRYIHRCDEGHVSSVVLMHTKYEILFQSGATALVLGFNREAISSFHVALERFFETATRIMARHKRVPDAVVADTWKLCNLSERQLGAFLFLYIVTFGRAFGFARELKDMTEVRNKVIHAGKIPTRDESKEYGRKVYTIVRTLNDQLAELDWEATRHFIEVEPGMSAPHERDPTTQQEITTLGSSFRKMILTHPKLYHSPNYPPPPVDFEAELADLNSRLRSR